VPIYQQLRADRAIVEQAAAHLRYLAIAAAMPDSQTSMSPSTWR